MLDKVPVVCPGCYASLVVLEGAWACSSCGRAGQPLGRLATLYAEPAAEHASIEVGATRHLRRATETAEGVQRQRELAPMMSRARLEVLGEGLRRYVAGLGQRWQEAGIALRSDGGPTRHDPRPTESQTLRDWAWPTHPAWSNENQQAYAQLMGHVNGELGRVLVLGAGAARLAYDLHTDASLTVALDLSPFPLLAAASLWGGETIEMWEFPPVPLEGPAHRWEVEAPPPSGALVALGADGLDPPFAAASFDTVVTPWFIDQIPRDLPRLLQVLRFLLVPGGRWLNLGPLIYPADSPMAARYGLSEVVQLAQTAGFDVDTPTSVRVQYLCSPVATQGRVEVVHAFAARRDEEGEVERPPPAWLGRPDLPIPRFSANPDHPVKAMIADAIDGRRNVRDIAEHLVRTRGMPPDDAATGVQLTISDLYAHRIR